MLRDAIKAGLAALPSDEQRRAFLGAAYKELVGYDPFEDDPNQTVEEITDLFVGVVIEGLKRRLSHDHTKGLVDELTDVVRLLDFEGYVGAAQSVSEAIAALGGRDQ